MDLQIKDVAELLNVSEATVKRWMSEGQIPSYRINQRNYFCRTEVENWVISHKLEKNETLVNPASSRDADKPSSSSPTLAGGSKQFSLFRAIHKGDVLHDLKGKNKEEIIRATMHRVAKILHADAEVMTDLLLDRENLMPTALNNGIAVPHTRDSLLDIHHDIVIVVFTDEPLEYGALDGFPVQTLFFLFACEDKRHLHLLAKIAHLSSQIQARDFLYNRPSKGQLLTFVKGWESAMATVGRR